MNMKCLNVFRVISFNPSGKFQGSEIRHWIFGGLIFGPGIFLVLLEALGILLDLDFCSHSFIPVT